MDFRECLKKRIAKEVSEDKELIESLFKTSQNKLFSEEKLKLDEVSASSKISLLYDSLRELLEALAIQNRFKIYNHECYTSFLKEVMNNGELAEEFDDIRKIRNSINYYGKEVSLTEAKEVLERMIVLRKRILNLFRQV